MTVLPLSCPAVSFPNDPGNGRRQEMINKPRKKAILRLFTLAMGRLPEKLHSIKLDFRDESGESSSLRRHTFGWQQFSQPQKEKL
ncbi:hypothetical protein RUM43_002123 [Polyplax serrata]|uniref:Uncharacterized protein n=1 Tax=Polyplax serrata TaxID=468196 RepID=A0AAN8S954_POLSC